MKHFKRLGVAGALVFTAACLAGSAQATQLNPAIAAVTFHSTNSQLALPSSAFTIRCTGSTITSRLPALAPLTWQSLNLTFDPYTGCTAGPVAAKVDILGGCHLSSTLILHAMGIGSNQAVWTITHPAGCSFSVTIPAFGCTLTINGPQTIGTGTTGFGGGTLTGGANPTIHLNNTKINYIVADGPTSATCSTTHTATGTLVGTYTSTSTVDVDGS